MKKAILFTVVLLLFHRTMNAQNIQIHYQDCIGCPQTPNSNTSINDSLFTYLAATPYTAGDVESDFDLRRANGDSRWHKGIDLRNHGQGSDMQRGDAVISPDSNGTIVAFRHTGYKYVIIDGDNHDFGYGHIFSHNNVSNNSTWRSGNFVLKMTEPDNVGTRRPCIVNLSTCQAYSRYPNRMVIMPNNHCNDTLITTDQVAMGVAFAPIGGSRSNATLDFPVHLHLYKFRNPTNGIDTANCMDPLVDVQHPMTFYDLGLTFNQNIESSTFNNWNQVSLNYPGTNTNTLGLRAAMRSAMQGFDPSRYNNVVHNLDEVQVLISNALANSFNPIFGISYRSEFLLHAREQTPLYPKNIHDHYGNQTTNGISPRAYQDGTLFRPYDNYYYTDFVTRVHKNDPMDGNSSPTMVANCPQNARYNDGPYVAKARVTDVHGGYFEGPRDSSGVLTPIEFTLDNFKPFIESINVSIGNEEVYDMEWSCSSTCNGIEPMGGVVSSEVFLEDLQQGMTILIEASEPMANLDMGISAYGDTLAETQIEFLDVSADQKLWQFRVLLDDIIDSVATVSQGDDIALWFWGNDFPTNGEPANQLLNLENYFHPDSTAGNVTCLPVPIRQGLNNQWLDTLGIPSGEELAHHFGLLCSSSGGLVEGNQAKSVQVLNGCCPENPFPDLTSEITPACIADSGSIELTFGPASIPPFEVLWSVDNQSGNLITNLNAGTYWATITDGEGCQSTEQFFVPGGNPSLTVEVIPATCLENNDGSIVLEIDGPFYQLTWSDDESGDFEDFTSRTNLAPDVYTVTLTNQVGCDTSYTFSTIPVEPQVTYPYLETMIVRAGGEIIYLGEWVEAATGCFFFEGGTLDIPSDLMDAMANGLLGWEIQVEFNKPMGFIQLGYEFSGGSGNITSPSPSGTIEYFFIPSSDVQQMFVNNAISQRIKVKGQDTEGNLIVNLREASTDLADCVDIPELDPVLCTWLPSLDDNPTWYLGGDDSHLIEQGCVALEFYVSESTEELCVEVEGDSSPSVSWQFPDGSWGFDQSCIPLANATTGEYCVKVVTSFGCFTTKCFSFCKEAAEISIELTPPCLGQNNGAICILNNEAPPILIEWLGGETTACLSDIPSGGYSVEITTLGCDLALEDLQFVEQIVLEDPSPLAYNLNSIGTCVGGQNGEACVFPSGGVGPYQVLWENGSEGACLSNLEAGCWAFTITDACGTSINSCVNIEEVVSSAPNVADYDSASSCSGGASGFFTIWINGDLGPYTFSLESENGEYSASTIHENEGHFTNLPGGNYNLTIVDHCQASYNFGPYNIQEFKYSVDLIASPSCDEMNNGSITSEVSYEGNNPPSYSYLWSNGATTSSVDQLSPGNYSVTVTELTSGCVLSEEIIVEQSVIELNQVTISGETITIDDTNPPTTTGLSDGSILPDFFSTEALSFSWSNGSTGSDLLGVPAGIYSLTVTDDNGCGSKFVFEVPECDGQGITPPYVNPSESSVSPISNTTGGDGTGDIFLDINGTAPFEISWTGPNDFTSSVQDITGLTLLGEYCVTVSNSCGSSNACFDLVQESLCEGLSLNFSVLNNCMDPDEGAVGIVFNGLVSDSAQYSPDFGRVIWPVENVADYRFTVSIDNNCQNNCEVSIVDEINGTNQVQIVNEGIYQITYTDSYGCEVTGTAQFINQAFSTLIYGNYTGPTLFPGINNHAYYEFYGCFTCGYTYDGNEVDHYCNYLGNENPDNIRRATFYPDADGGVGAENVCQQGGVVVIDASYVDQSLFGQDIVIPLYEEIVIPANSTAQYYTDLGQQWIGCVFPEDLFEYPTNFRHFLNYPPALFAPISTNDYEPTWYINISISYDDFDTDCTQFDEVPGDPDTFGCPTVDVFCSEEGHEDEDVLLGNISGGLDSCYCTVTQSLGGGGIEEIMYLFTTCKWDPTLVIGSAEMISSSNSAFDEIFSTKSRCSSNICDEYVVAFNEDDPVFLSQNDDPQAAYTERLSRERGIPSARTSIVQKIYPNPSNSRFEVELLSNRQEELKMKVVNSMNELVFEETLNLELRKASLTIDFTDQLPAGLYFLILSDEEGFQEVHKLLYVK